MTTKPIQVAFVENVITNYRVDFFERLARYEDFEITVFCSDAKGVPKLKIVENVSGFKYVRVPAHGSEKYFVWQKLPFKDLRRNYDIVCYYANPRYLSTLFATTCDYLFGRPCVLRNHYKTAGKDRLSERIRLFWTRRFKNILVYTRKEVATMRKDGFLSHNLEGWGNGLNGDEIKHQIQSHSQESLQQWKSQVGIEDKTVIVSVGRLIARNQFEQIPNAIKELNSEFKNLLWCVIGDGSCKDVIRNEAIKLGVADQVRFLGPIYEESELARWFLSAVGLVHPGTIGLSMIHAFAYGLPVVTHNSRRMHNPEFDAATNENSFLYPFGKLDLIPESIRSLCQMTNKKSKGENLNAWRTSIRDNVLLEHSTEIMAHRTANFLRNIASSS